MAYRQRRVAVQYIRIFFFNDTATTEIYTLSLHDALPISTAPRRDGRCRRPPSGTGSDGRRSEEHTSELQSQSNLVCRLLLEKKNKIKNAKGVSGKYCKASRSFSSNSSNTPFLFVP